MSKALPAIDLINQQLRAQVDEARAHSKSLLIGIDGNEANVENRVGSNNYAYKIIKALSQLDTNHRFIVYLKHPPLADMPPQTENFKYRIIPFSRLWSQTRLPLQLWLSRNRPDVFFVPGHYVSSFIPMPAVITIMDLAFLTHPNYFKSSDLFKLRQWTKASIDKASHILTISQSSQQDILDYYDIPSELTTVTYIGIDHDRFTFPQPDDEINRVTSKYNIEKDYILYVGTLQPRKNLVNLIKAFSQLDRDDYQLVIAGKKGWMYDDIFSIVQKLDLSQKVIFTDFVPDEDLPGLMAGARCLALVSLYEGFGIPVVEAQAVGTPAVVSNVSSLPEILGGAGLAVDPDNIPAICKKLREIIDLSQDDYYQLAEKGIKHAKMFQWDHAAKVALQVLEQL